MEKENLICPICGPLAAQTKEPLNGSYRQYDQILAGSWNWSGKAVWNCLPVTARWRIPMRCWMPSSIIPFATMCGAADAALSILWGPASGAHQYFGR